MKRKRGQLIGRVASQRPERYVVTWWTRHGYPTRSYHATLAEAERAWLVPHLEGKECRLEYRGATDV